MLPSQRKYWLQIGWSRPSCFISRARFASVLLGPRIVVVGSPGSRCTSMKIPTETMNKIPKSAISLLSKNFAIAWTLPCRLRG